VIIGLARSRLLREILIESTRYRGFASNFPSSADQRRVFGSAERNGWAILAESATCTRSSAINNAKGGSS